MRNWLALLAVLPLCLATVPVQDEAAEVQPQDPAPVAPLSEETEAPAPFDYSRYFSPEAHAQKAASNTKPTEESSGFVEPIDFKNILGGSPAFGQQQKQAVDTSPFFGHLNTGASNTKTATFPSFGTPFGAQADASADVGFRQEDFIKSKRGASEKALARDNSFFSPNFFGGEGDYTAKEYQPARYIPETSASETQGAEKSPKKDSFDDDFSFANFEDEDDDDQKYHSEDDDDGASRPATATSKRKEKNSKYPSYSSYYHNSQPQEADGNRGASTDDDDDAEYNEKSGEDPDFRFDADEGSSSEKVQKAPNSPSASSSEAYNSRPRLDSVRKTNDYKYGSNTNSPKNARPSVSGSYSSHEEYKDPLTGAYQPGPSSTDYSSRGPARFELNSGFKPSPLDPLYASPPNTPELEAQSVSPFNPGPAHYRVGQLGQPSLQSRSGSASAPNKSNCRKVHKQVGVGPPSGMSCFVCDDPKTGGSYEQCAYGSEPVSRAYYVGRSEAFRSDKDKPYTYRRRRYLTVGPAPASGETSEEPLTRRAREEPDDEFFGFSESDKDDRDDYRFGPEYFEDHGDDAEGEGEAEHSPSEAAAQSESQVRPSAKADEKCEKKIKKGSVCMVCTDPKTGGNYEQCQYTDKPETQSYSFGRSSSYGSPSSERRRRYIENGDRSKGKAKQQQQKQDREQKAPSSQNAQSRKYSAKTNSKSAALQKRRDDEGVNDDVPYVDAEYEIPPHQVKSEKKADPKKTIAEVLGLESSLYGPDEPFGPPDEEKLIPQQAEAGEPVEHVEQDENIDQKSKEAQESSTKSYDDYFSFLFPELSSKKKQKVKPVEVKKKPKDKKQGAAEEGSDEVGLIGQFDDDHFVAESKDDKPGFVIADYFTDPGPKKDLEKMLGEFTQKDRSDCTRVEKDHMTCFQCLDKKGMQHEECMFVAASEPKKSHLAYHESTEYKKKPTTTPEPIAIKEAETSASVETTRVRDTEGAAAVQPTTATIKTQTSKATAKATADKPSRRKVRGEKKFQLSDLTTTLPTPVAAAAATAARSRQQRGLVEPTPTSRQVQRRATAEAAPAAQKQQQQPQEEHEESEGDDDDDDDEEDDGHDEQDGDGEKSPQKEASSDSSEQQFTTPKGPEGLYSEETKPVFDKVLKLSLPKYMLTKSEHEEVFDEVLASGAK